MAETILNRRIVMASRPTGMPTPENFRMEEVEEPCESPEGGVLLKTLFFSLDPYMRGRMDAGPSYAQALEPGGVMEGGSVPVAVTFPLPSAVNVPKSVGVEWRVTCTVALGIKPEAEIT